VWENTNGVGVKSKLGLGGMGPRLGFLGIFEPLLSAEFQIY
jgi:hypothetical protein